LVAHRFAARVAALLYLFPCYGPHRDLHSFPTRRSSDLACGLQSANASVFGRQRHDVADALAKLLARLEMGNMLARQRDGFAGLRSEEHTSELQSRENLVCRLLLEKKNKMDATGHTQALF